MRFLFCDHDADELKALLSRQIKELDFKIMLNGQNGDIFITFSEVTLTFMPGAASVDDLLGEVLVEFDKKASLAKQT